MATFALVYDDDEESMPDTASPPPPRTPCQSRDDDGLETDNEHSMSPTVPGTPIEPSTWQLGQDDNNSQPHDKNSPAPSGGPVATIHQRDQPESPFDWEELNLDTVPPQAFSVRVLILPHKLCTFSSYPTGSSCGNWVDVETRDATEESEKIRLWASGPGEQQPGFCVTCDKIQCVVLFDPDSDRIIVRNQSSHLVSCKLNRTAKIIDIQDGEIGVITPGEWEFTADENECLFKLKLLSRTPLHIRQVPHTKRSAADKTSSNKKARQSVGLSFERITIPRDQFPSNPLISLNRGEIVQVGTGEDDYAIKLLGPVNNGRVSTVYKAEHSNMPGKVVTVKVIKPHCRNRESTVEAIETWIREFSIHSTLGNHYAIIPYLGSDARFNAIYTEHIDAKPLIYHIADQGAREFNGNIVRAWRILGDMASALSFLHSKNIVHGDIHLTNILFHPVRGAILTNFDLSFEEGKNAAGNGAPWYLPPEFLDDSESRCSASDMWALGVVMLWVLGKIPMPESTTYWIVEDIHPTGPTTQMNHKQAQCQMEDWLAKVRAGNRELKEERGEIAPLVDALVQELSHERIDAATLVQELTMYNLNEGSDFESISDRYISL
ncbi:kinase-like domain-containing protein [Xylaria bambusicola]|uniref:kinase-like domain-containing protein n=1 Tax=Xylaria bambusicola TaxID=326684 RepID=UPI0020088C00|nr:kinase-like domain-containing protein [Xylaria bambusicola]KAI0515113.1 kinase-like domain-containing protein [Xylaria bambusicola]